LAAAALGGDVGGVGRWGAGSVERSQGLKRRSKTRLRVERSVGAVGMEGVMVQAVLSSARVVVVMSVGRYARGVVAGEEWIV
jgi:hypothetical protein